LYNYSPVPLSGNLYDAALAGGFAFPQTLDDWISPKWAEFSQRRGVGVPWVDQNLRLRVRNFERVLNAYYPTVTDIRLTPFRRGVLRATSAWRFHLKYYDFPLELRALQKILHYQRPETSGF
jgi:hypothetical protein